MYTQYIAMYGDSVQRYKKILKTIQHGLFRKDGSMPRYSSGTLVLE
jgi:hypothetical protein